MKIQGPNGKQIHYTAIEPDEFTALTDLTRKCLADSDHVLICITGNKGIGKTTLGKYIRKKGFGPFKPSDVAVIDDDCMSVDVLFFFRRKYVNPCIEVDELHPFFRFCKNRKLRFYVKSNPESRITKADILINLHLDEDKRKQRLIQRYGRAKGERVFQQTQSFSHIPKIKTRYELSISAP